MKKASNNSGSSNRKDLAQLRLLEKHIQEQCVSFFLWENWLAYRNNPLLGVIVGTQTAVASCEPGTPDYRFEYPLMGSDRQPTPLCLNVWVEFKRPGETLSPKQEKWHFEHRKRGELIWVVDSYERLQDLYVPAFGWLRSSKHAIGQSALFALLPEGLRPCG